MREKKSSPTLARADRHEIPCEWAPPRALLLPSGRDRKMRRRERREASIRAVGTGRMAGHWHWEDGWAPTQPGQSSSPRRRWSGCAAARWWPGLGRAAVGVRRGQSRGARSSERRPGTRLGGTLAQAGTSAGAGIAGGQCFARGGRELRCYQQWRWNAGVPHGHTGGA
jgi:hypothetical protein